MKHLCVMLVTGLVMTVATPGLADNGTQQPSAEQPHTFVMPSDKAMLTFAKNPDAFGAAIANASEEQAALVIIQIISLMQANGAKPSDIQQAVATLFAKTAEVRGADFGAAVVTRVRKKVNPRLLPIIAFGGAPTPPPPPGPSPLYNNQ